MLSQTKGRVEAAIAAVRQGRPVLLVDDEERENEADLVIAAEMVSPENMNFLIRNGSGIVCLALTESKADQLQLPLMVEDNGQSRPFSARFTVSIEARTGITSGVSAADRATTIKTAIKESANPSDLCRPGHVFPLRAANGGLAQRRGHTEGSVALARLAGFTPAAAVCELLNADGSIPSIGEAKSFAESHDLTIISIQDLLEFS